MTRKIEALVFDADGVVIDSFDRAAAASMKILAAERGRGVRITNRNEYEKEWVSYVDDLDPTARQHIGDLHTALMSETAVGAQLLTETLAVVARTQVRRSIVTTSLSMNVRVALQDLSNLFTPILGREHGSKLQILSQMDPAKAIYIGDTASDIRICKEIGMRIIAMATPSSFHSVERIRAAEPDYIVQSAETLALLLEKLGVEMEGN